MPPKKKSKTSESAGRKTWDVKKYENDADKGAENPLDNKPRKKLPLGKVLGDLEARKEHVDVERYVGKFRHVSDVSVPDATSSFYCKACEYEAKDNKNYLDHLNSAWHLAMIGSGSRAKRATLEDVQMRLKMHSQPSHDTSPSKAEETSSAINENKEDQDDLAAQRRKKRELKKQKKQQAAQEAEESEIDPEMVAMGFDFASFGGNQKR